MGIPPSRPGRHPPDRSRGGARGATRWRRSLPNPAAVARTGSVLEQAPRAEVLDSILAEFTRGWDRGESPRVEEVLDRLGPCAPDDLIELIYHEFCLAEAAGDDPEPLDYLARFPTCRDRLARLFGLHGALGASLPRPRVEPVPLPESGDEVGPYRLVRELGRGRFAQVFLAEQGDLDGRLVVLKVSARPSPEPRLLARARHPHIVEVLRHATADDGALHLVCMPFWGGATLAAVLDERRRRARRPKRGRDFLADLDQVSAPEYPPPPGRSRPAREVMARGSYPQAVAWIVARLAEALDHARRRGVLHGDLKPSNVLLTADGQPMLFDFNLAVDWHASAEGGIPGETGGTLAYMAPERLLAVAEPELTPPPGAAARHRADLYALGLLLREALTGRPPEIPEERGGGARRLAAALAAARGRAGWVRAATRGVSPGLRPILDRCLAPDPADRYGRAAELAEDLDRWRADRHLAYADEPAWRFGLMRWARRQRIALAAGGSVVLAGAGVALVAREATTSSRRELATVRLSALLDQGEPAIFRLHRFGRWDDSLPEDPAETARRHLARYGVLDDLDWRTRDDVAALASEDRGNLEAWLMEQAWRFAHSLADRPNSPEDWRRALFVLERAAGTSPPGPIAEQGRELRLRLGLPESPTSPPTWLDDYLRGVEAEADGSRREALRHYQRVLTHRPNAFWAHYRAASAAWRIGEFHEAADQLNWCVQRHRDNPLLHVQRAACLSQLGRFDEALRECNDGLRLAPDLAEGYRTRAFIRDGLGQSDGLLADRERFELLMRPRGRAAAWGLHLDALIPGALNLSIASRDRAELPRRTLEAYPEDTDVRTLLAWRLERNGRRADALAELDRVLEVSPRHLRARFQRGRLLLALGRRYEGAREYLTVIRDPRIEELLLDPSVIRAFHVVASDFLDQGKTAEALEVARQGLDHANRLRDFRAESDYALGRVYAVASRIDPGLEAVALSYFRRACHRSPTCLVWISRDPLIADPIELISRLQEVPSSPGSE